MQCFEYVIFANLFTCECNSFTRKKKVAFFIEISPAYQGATAVMNSNADRYVDRLYINMCIGNCAQ